MFTYSNLINSINNDTNISNRLNPTALPLWSSRRMFDHDYLEVNVTKEVPLEKSTDDILNINTYTCHICDTEVPKTHITLHNEGEKHQLCLKIADIALERARQHMKLNIKEPAIALHVADTYFCDPCSAIKLTKDKILHEASETHRKAVKYNNLLKNFSLIYEDKDAAIFNDNFEDFKQICVSQTEINGDMDMNHERSDSKQSNERNKSECNSDDENYSRKDSTNEIKSESKSNIDKTDIVATIEKEPTNEYNIQYKSAKEMNVVSKRMDKIKTKSIKEVERKNTEKTVTELAKYLENLSEKYKDTTHTLEALTDKIIAITALNGDRIKVPLNNFHSIHAQKERSYCKVCEDPNIGWRHAECEEHMEKVMVPIEDQNGIRKVDDVWSHCVLCNDLTKNIAFHLQSLLHRNKLKNAFLPNTTDINQNVIHKPSEHSTQLIQQHGLIASHNRSEIFCNICEVSIPNHLTSIKTHIGTFEHETTYSGTIEENRLTEIDEAEFYCVPCDMVVAKCFALGHCNGKKHKKHLAQVLEKENVTVESTQVIIPSILQQVTRSKPKNCKTESDLICFVCNTVLYNLNSHMNSLEHKKNYFSYLEANKLNEIEEDMFFCFPCNTVMLIDYLMCHCNAKKHKLHLKNFISNASSQDQKGQTGQVIAENSHIARSITESKQNSQASLANQKLTPSQNLITDTAIPLKHIYQFTELGHSSLLCSICDEEVAYKKHDVQNHVTLIEHVVAFNLKMLWNKIKRRNDKYFCDYCKVDVTYFNEVSHVTDPSHVDMMSKDSKGTVYEYDRELLTLEFAMSHKIGDRVRPRSLVVSKPKNDI